MVHDTVNSNYIFTCNTQLSLVNFPYSNNYRKADLASLTKYVYVSITYILYGPSWEKYRQNLPYRYECGIM